jgi:hypothetical protein
MHRHLNDNIRCAWFDDQLIILDLTADAYVILSHEQSQELRAASKYSTGNQSPFICLFKRELFELPDPKLNAARASYTGVSENCWSLSADEVAGIRSLKKLRRALQIVHLVHKTSNKHRIHGLIGLLRKHPQTGAPGVVENNLAEYTRTLNLACLVYPRRTKCLEWAFALNILHAEFGVRSKIVIGVQNRPFYAHAWVEADATVCGDDSRLREQLSVIYEST